VWVGRWQNKEADMLARMKRLAWRHIPWLYCVGATLFLLSWLGEKQSEKEFARKHDHLLRLEHQLSTNRSIAQLWYSHMHLLGAQQPKGSQDQAVAFAALWYMEFTVNALQAAVAWGDENAAEQKKLVESRRADLEAAKTAFRDGQYAKAITISSHLRSTELQWADRLASGNSPHFRALEAQKDLRDWIFRILYLVAAGLIGFAFVRDRLRSAFRDRGDLILSE
jgi:hypothetical protein